MPCCFSFFNSTARVPLTTHRLVTPLPHIQPVSNDIHSSSLISNKRKRHKNIKAINTTTSPSILFLVSIVIVRKHPQAKTKKNIFPWNFKTSSYSHPNPKVKNLLHLVLKYIFKISNSMMGIILSWIYSIHSNSSMFVEFFKIIN